MPARKHVQQGRFGLIVREKLGALDRLHGYGIYRRIEHSGYLLPVTQAPVYPLVLKLEHEREMPPSGAPQRTPEEPASAGCRGSDASSSGRRLEIGQPTASR